MIEDYLQQIRQDGSPSCDTSGTCGGLPDRGGLVTLAVMHRLLAFQRRYEQTAVWFAWRFTRADLDRLLHRLAGEERPLRVA